MKFLARICIVAALSVIVIPASAKIIPGSCNGTTCLDDLVVTIDNGYFNGYLMIVSTDPVPAPAPAPPVQQNTISTTGPVASSTTISVGTISGEVLKWVASTFGTLLGTLAVAILYRAFNYLGFKVSADLRDKLQSIVVNGINKGAADAQKSLEGKGQIEIKSAAVANAVKYVQAHGADTLNQLGIDPNSNVAVDAIKARIETAINDVNTPTPPVLAAPTTPAKV